MSAVTPIYMAPETFTQNIISSKGDVFSFLFILYQSLSGNDKLIPGDSTFAIASNIIYGIRPDLSYIEQEEIISLLTNMWVLDPKDLKSFYEIVSFFLDSFR